MAIELSYPSEQAYAFEIPFWCMFSCAKYSVINTNRTRNHINSFADVKIALPFTSEPKMSLTHKFSEGTNPVGPVLSMAGLKNTSGGDDTFLERLAAPAAAFYEATFTTDTFRRFSNVTEATMTSEARREFKFQYLMAPKTAKEAETVDAIVNTFRNYSYPTVVPGLPERTFPQNLWTIRALSYTSTNASSSYLTSSWLGDPLPCVLVSIQVEKGDPADPVLKVLPNTRAAVTMLTLSFSEFETGTYAPNYNGGSLLSKSEVSALGEEVG